MKKKNYIHRAVPDFYIPFKREANRTVSSGGRGLITIMILLISRVMKRRAERTLCSSNISIAEYLKTNEMLAWRVEFRVNKF